MLFCAVCEVDFAVFLFKSRNPLTDEIDELAVDGAVFVSGNITEFFEQFGVDSQTDVFAVLCIAFHVRISKSSLFCVYFELDLCYNVKSELEISTLYFLTRKNLGKIAIFAYRGKEKTDCEGSRVNVGSYSNPKKKSS